MTHFLKITTKTVLLCLALVAFGDSAAYADAALKPYEVRYLTKQWGMKLKLTRSLLQQAEHSYLLRENGSVMLQKLGQESHFCIEGGTLIPQHFSYELSGVVSRSRKVEFPDKLGEPVRSLYKGSWYDFPWRAGMLDRLSQQEQVRLYLMEHGADNIDQSLAFTVVDGRKVKDYTLDFVGRERLSTALGEMDTVHFTRKHPNNSRQTDIWLAPQWDYLMVRTRHTEDNKTTEAVITGGNIDGIALADIKPLAE